LVPGDGSTIKVKKPKPRTPIYKPGDPRIARDLRRGAGVGVDLSKLSPEERVRWEEQVRQQLMADPVREATELMKPPNERFPQEDASEDE